MGLLNVYDNTVRRDSVRVPGVRTLWRVMLRGNPRRAWMCVGCGGVMRCRGREQEMQGVVKMRENIKQCDGRRVRWSNRGSWG